MIRRQKKAKKKSRIGTGLKVAAGVALAGGALVAGKKLVDKVRGKGGGGRRRKRGAIWYAREITRLKLKKRYDKLKIGA